jgi:polysaccharide export outer membrane protein
MTQAWFALVLTLAVAPASALAQTAQPPSSPSPGSTVSEPAGPSSSAPLPAAGQTSNPAYRIGPQDELRVTVFGEAELSQLYRVEADGFITMPLIGRISAGGLTLEQLQTRITRALEDGFIKNPEVRVEVSQYKSKAVYVIGEVRAPGKITMTGTQMTLLEALALAGSPTSNASNQVIVVHPAKPSTSGAPNADTEGQRITVNRRDLELGKVGQDIVLQDGDIINVPVAQRFYISGMVRNPGFYVLDPGMTVQQAIALAGGLNDRGSDRRITATRVVNGKSEDVKVELDDKVEPNDVLNIPSRFF